MSVDDEYMFPVLNAGISVPWQFIAPFELQAVRNHGQSLKVLARRGGLDPLELLIVVNGMTLRQLDEAKKMWPSPREAVLAWVEDCRNSFLEEQLDEARAQLIRLKAIVARAGTVMRHVELDQRVDSTLETLRDVRSVLAEIADYSKEQP